MNPQTFSKFMIFFSFLWTFFLIVIFSKSWTIHEFFSNSWTFPPNFMYFFQPYELLFFFNFSWTFVDFVNFFDFVNIFLKFLNSRTLLELVNFFEWMIFFLNFAIIFWICKLFACSRTFFKIWKLFKFVNFFQGSTAESTVNWSSQWSTGQSCQHIKASPCNKKPDRAMSERANEIPAGPRLAMARVSYAYSLGAQGAN